MAHLQRAVATRAASSFTRVNCFLTCHVSSHRCPRQPAESGRGLATKAWLGCPLSSAQRSGLNSRRRRLATRSSVAPEQSEASTVRVRFAPSPTGNLHVGGARTALFNWLLARGTGGSFILRVEDTDLERSTRESESAVLRDLRWLGLDWDEGPDVGGPYGPYRQSERNQIYKDCAEKLLREGKVYRCFCSDEELEAMRAEQEARKLPPKYAGKWARASDAEIAAELEKGTPHTFRFRVPEDQTITIQDAIRGEVSWNTDTLGDFVLLRSNGQPVYNFCVAVDDANMRISHVIRAEEHLPNTLRQALIYEALGFRMPTFGHVSLILAPDRSKLSKRHGATSVGQFKEMGFLPEAMVNYLSLLGWNDGTEEEIFTRQQLVERFSLERVTKSGAIFDNAKLRWMNGQHLRVLEDSQVEELLLHQFLTAGILTRGDAELVKDTAALLKKSLEVLPDSTLQLQEILSYPLQQTLQSGEAEEVLGDNIQEVAAAVLEAYNSGELRAAIDGGHDSWQAWTKAVGKAQKRKGKRLFMPLRILLTGRMHGPDVGAILTLVDKFSRSDAVGADVEVVTLDNRVQSLQQIDFGAFGKQREIASMN